MPALKGESYLYFGLGFLFVLLFFLFFNFFSPLLGFVPLCLSIPQPANREHDPNLMKLHM